jgi:FAD binding domain-containing protein
MPHFTPTNLKEWTNRHESFTQSIDNLFDLSNNRTGNALNDYNATTTAIQEKIGEAIAANKTIRALGGGWSWTGVAAADGWIFNTKQLNTAFNVGLPNIAANYTGNKEQLLFAQCGNSIQELNNFLKSKNKSLKTSGASNGQTIVGLFSTGSHGSAIDFGATQEFIVGLHIILSPGRHIWLEKASHPVVSDVFISKLQTELVRNDDWFNAAVVSFGSFGFIHGAMLETEPIYLLETYRKRIPLDASLKHVMETLDFSNTNLTTHGNERPFHFQVVVNQYDLQNGAYATIMYKRQYTTAYQPPVVDLDMAGPGDDVPAFFGRLTNIIPNITPRIVNQMIKTSFTTFSNVLGTSGEIFTNNQTRGKVLSTAMGVDISNVNEVNDLLIQLNATDGPFTGIFSYRYVKKSEALLAFTKFPHTCIVELDGVESPVTRNFYDAVWSELDARNIPYTFHWGKINNLTAAMVLQMYQGNLQKWITARNQLLPADSKKVFNNQALYDWGLDQ